MDTAAARARLERMVAVDAQPRLTAAEVEDLLGAFRLVDAAGLAPDETGWEPTYDLNGAAAEGWRWKEAKATELVNFSADGASFNRGDIVKACAAMAEYYDNRAPAGPGPAVNPSALGSIPLVPSSAYRLPPEIVANLGAAL